MQIRPAAIVLGKAGHRARRSEALSGGWESETLGAGPQTRSCSCRRSPAAIIISAPRRNSDALGSHCSPSGYWRRDQNRNRVRMCSGPRDLSAAAAERYPLGDLQPLNRPDDRLPITDSWVFKRVAGHVSLRWPGSVIAAWRFLTRLPAYYSARIAVTGSTRAARIAGR